MILLIVSFRVVLAFARYLSLPQRVSLSFAPRLLQNRIHFAAN